MIQQGKSDCKIMCLCNPKNLNEKKKKKMEKGSMVVNILSTLFVAI